MDRPNVLLLLEDQLRYDVVDRAELCRTPTLDAFRGEGVYFRQAYTPAGICSPARGSLFTGLYPHTHGLLNNIHGTDAVRRDLPREHTTVAEALREAGYRTGYVGKWHIGMRDGPRERGFDEWRASDNYLADDQRFRPYWSRFTERAPDAVFTRYLTGPPDRLPRVPFPLYSLNPVPEEIVPARAVLDAASAILETGRAGPPSSWLRRSWSHTGRTSFRSHTRRCTTRSRSPRGPTSMTPSTRSLGPTCRGWSTSEWRISRGRTGNPSLPDTSAR